MISATALPKRIALVAHDNCKADLVKWADYNLAELRWHQLVATRTTGTIRSTSSGWTWCLHRGPLGGDLQGRLPLGVATTRAMARATSVGS